MSKKCKYYRESEICQYTPGCTGTADSVHPQDVDTFCSFCGGKIKLKEFTEVPKHLDYFNNPDY
jgi:hypothetical protein